MVDKQAANVYDKVSNVQSDNSLFLLDHLTINTKDSVSVLDLGCGTGRLAAVIADRVGPEGSIIGVDPDQDRIQVAISKGDERIQFIVGDDTSFPEGQYDVITCTDVIHWIKDKEATFKRVYDNLKPGGRFGFTTNTDTPPEPLRTMLSLVGGLEDLLSTDLIEPMDTYKELAKIVGFEITFTEIKEKDYNYATIDDYAEFFYGTFHGKYDLINHKSLNELKQDYRDNKRSVTFTAHSLIVVLTKPL